MTLWAAKWVSENQLDGRREHIIYDDLFPKLFRTRAAARAWIKQEYGYITERRDLQVEPHGWRLPQAIKVKIQPVTAEESHR